MELVIILFKTFIILTNLLICLCLISVTELIPRTFLFNNPKYSQISISPNGKTIAYLAANDIGIINIYTKCLTCKYPIPVTFETSKHIIGIF